MNPMQAPNVGVGGKDFGGGDRWEVRTSTGVVFSYVRADSATEAIAKVRSQFPTKLRNARLFASRI
jgi:hypothetical protein